MTVRIAGDALDAVLAHGRATYPEEGCGFLIGDDGPPRRVIEARPARNAWSGPKAARYAVDPAETLQVMKELRGTAREIVGFFHSHPDHPAEPSPFDRDRAWTFYTYVIVSVAGGDPRDVRAWSLQERESERVFREEAIERV